MYKGQKCYGYVNGKQYQVLLYPQDYISITQSPYGAYSHKCSKHGGNSGCWDINKTSGAQTELYAPCDCHRVAYLSGEGNGNQCMYQSDEKVIFANGTLDYAFFGFGHDGRSVCKDSTTDYTPLCAYTKNFKQGDLMGYTGCYGDSALTGIHSHWIIGKGVYLDEKDTTDAFECCTGSFGHNCKQFISPNPIDIDDMFYANGTQITSNGQQTSGGGAVCTWKLYSCGGTIDPTPDPNPTPTDKWEVTLNVSPSGSGYTKGQGTYSNGERAYLYAYANQGWKFTKWSDGYTSSERYWDITSNLTLTAYFEELTYNITGSVQDDKGTANTGGSISGLGTYKYGTSHDIGITADKQYVIESIKVNGNEVLSDSEVSKITSYTYHIDSLNQDYNIIVTFRKKGILINGYGGIDFQIL